MADLYKEFILTSPTVLASLHAFLDANAAGVPPLRVIITDEESDRLDEQVRFYFAVLVQSTAEQVWLDRGQFHKDTWHEYFCEKFLPKTEVMLPFATKPTTVRQSIARGRIGVRAMAKFINEVEAHAVQELGVHLPARE